MIRAALETLGALGHGALVCATVIALAALVSDRLEVLCDAAFRPPPIESRPVRPAHVASYPRRQPETDYDRDDDPPQWSRP